MISSYTLGLVFISIVALVWSASSVVVQYLYQDLNFNSPFLLTYIVSSLFIIYIPIRLSMEALGLTNKIPWRNPPNNDSRSDINNGDLVYSSQITVQKEIPGPDDKTGTEVDNISDTPDEGEGTMLSHVEHFIIGAKIALIWFISNWCYHQSLGFTSITSSTVLASTGSVFTYIFSMIDGLEQFTKMKFTGVVLSFLGSMITSYHDLSPDGDAGEEDMYVDPLWGDVVALVAAIGYGGYTVLIRKLCPSDENQMSMQLLLGYIGAINMIVFAPGAIWVLCTNFEFGDIVIEENDDTENYFEQKSNITWFVFFVVVTLGILNNVIADYLWARAVILTTATVATVGVGLTIPLALLSDAFIMRLSGVWNASSILGALFVLGGFAFVNMSELKIDIPGFESNDNLGYKQETPENNEDTTGNIEEVHGNIRDTPQAATRELV